MMTTASTTKFCAEQVVPPYGPWIDGNGKITAGNGTLEEPAPNAFSLPQIASCPGRTRTCSELCYVYNLEKHVPDTHAMYVHNFEWIKKVLGGRLEDHGPIWWANKMAEYISTHCSGGFRWHVSGDLFSEEYAEFVKVVCLLSPGVNHWIYTRSFDLLHILVDVDNLVINLSVDQDNYDAGRDAALIDGLRLCYLTKDGSVPPDLDDGDVIFPDYSLRKHEDGDREWFEALPPRFKAMVCPVDYHGKSERRRCGPCNRCLV